MPVPGDFARPLAGPGVDRVEGEVGLVVPGVVRRRPEDLAAALGDVLAPLAHPLVRVGAALLPVAKVGLEVAEPRLPRLFRRLGLGCRAVLTLD